MSSSPTSTVVDVNMPQMGVSVAEGTVVEWKKRVGDWIEADETIVEISTDKVETEVPAPAAGRLTEILVEPGTTVDVGTLLARIDTGARPGEAHADEHSVAAAEAERERAAEAEQAPAAEAENGKSAAAAPSRAESADGPPPPVSPVVRRIADEHGVDLSRVEGSGRRGRVTKKDVLAFIESGEEDRPLHIESPYREDEPPVSPPAEKPAAEPETPVSPRDRVHAEGPEAPEAAEVPSAPQPAGEPLSVMRQRIGEHMKRSLETAAHCTTIVEADMSRIEAARGRLSYLPFVARATIAALREYPTLNATLHGDRLAVHEEVNLGIAVSLGEQGLIVPVVHNAHELSHEGLGARIKDLAQRAREKKLKPEEVQGGTFTITNPGLYGALLATPIINQPQVAILDLEAVVRRPVVVDGDSIAIRPMTYLCMSWDHRALDGAIAAQFLSAVRRHIEGFDG